MFKYFEKRNNLTNMVSTMALSSFVIDIVSVNLVNMYRGTVE